jgi:hypothetical protein
MSGLPGDEPADVTLKSDVPPLEDFPPGDVRRLPEAPGHLYQGLPAASTSGQRQVLDEDYPFNFELESRDGDDDALLRPAPGGSQTVLSGTTGSTVGGSASTYSTKT